jgi:hypothetical protein
VDEKVFYWNKVASGILVAKEEKSTPDAKLARTKPTVLLEAAAGDCM